MILFDEDLGYDYYRQTYLEDLENSLFPWRAAYYYYLQHIDRIDIMGFDKFKTTILKENNSYTDRNKAFEEISSPIYESLDKYFEPIHVLDKNNNILKVC